MNWVRGRQPEQPTSQQREITAASALQLAAAKQLREERRAAYLSPGHRDFDRQQELVAVRGFRLVADAEGRVTDILWPSEEQFKADYVVFCRVLDFLWKTAHKNDALFQLPPQHRGHKEECLSPFQEVEAILFGTDTYKQVGGMPFFIQLNDPMIPVSLAHTGISPAAHSCNVLAELKTDGLSTGPLERVHRFNQRIRAIFHDLGKLFIAQGDTFQDHAQISYYLLRKLIYYYCLKQEKTTPERAQELAELLAGPVRYHHIFEQVEDGFLSVAEAAQVIEDPSYVPDIAALTMADRMSIKGAGKNLVFALLVFKDYPAVLAQFFGQDPTVAILSQRMQRACFAQVHERARHAPELVQLFKTVAVPALEHLGCTTTALSDFVTDKQGVSSDPVDAFFASLVFQAM